MSALAFRLNRTQLIAAGVVVTVVTAGLAWRSRPPTVPVVELQPAPLQRTLLFSARVAAVTVREGDLAQVLA